MKTEMLLELHFDEHFKESYSNFSALQSAEETNKLNYTNLIIYYLLLCGAKPRQETHSTQAGRFRPRQ